MPEECRLSTLTPAHSLSGASAVLQEFRREGVDAFATSWHAMLTRIAEKSAA